MPEVETTPRQQRLLAGLFTRSHIANRRRRYSEGYLMSELDGVTLSQSDIWQCYSELQGKGLISSAVVNSNLVLKLTPEGDQYCRLELFPELFDGGAAISGPALEKPSIGAEPTPEEVTFAEGKSIDEIRDHLLAHPGLAETLADLKTPDGLLNESAQAQIRRAVVQLENAIPNLELGNFEVSQAKAYLQIVMILADSPTPAKADVFKYIQGVGILFGIATSGGTLAVAILTYLAVHGAK